jgi:hypothetical protein
VTGSGTSCSHGVLASRPSYKSGDVQTINPKSSPLVFEGIGGNVIGDERSCEVCSCAVGDSCRAIRPPFFNSSSQRGSFQ